MLNYFLVIDNTENEHNFELAIRRLNKNFRLLTAHSCKEGLRMYRKINPSIVLINFQLEDMTGLECLRQIMSVQKKKIAPVYIYHRLITPHLVTRALHNGARGCLTFNHEGKDLTNCLAEILKDNKLA